MLSPISQMKKLKHRDIILPQCHRQAGLNPRNLIQDISSVLLPIKIYLASFMGEGMSDPSADEPFLGELSLDDVAQSRILVPRISFSMMWNVGLDLPSYLMGIFPLGRIYLVVKKCLHLQKDNWFMFCSRKEWKGSKLSCPLKALKSSF